MNALMVWSDGNEKVDQAFQPQQALGEVCVQQNTICYNTYSRHTSLGPV